MRGRGLFGLTSTLSFRSSNGGGARSKLASLGAEFVRVLRGFDSGYARIFIEDFLWRRGQENWHNRARNLDFRFCSERVHEAHKLVRR
jgi:hypothetical protein